MSKYSVYVDDNAHSQDEKERYKLADFDVLEEAVAACRKIVDEFFQDYEPGKHSYDKLWEQYTMFGEDPFILSEDKKLAFSAWDYAKELCQKLSAGQEGDNS
jgi:hypothetical protein